MRKLFALILIALLLGVGVVAVIETDPGYLLLAYGDYTLESSLWVGLVLLVLFTLMLYGLVALLRRLLGGQKSLAGWLGGRRARKASRLTNSGLVSFIEGNWTKSRRQLVRGTRSNDAPLVNYLLAAQASSQLGEEEQTREYLAAAAESDTGAAVAVALAKAELQLQAGEYRQAIEALRGARRNPGRYPQGLRLLQRAYTGVEDWAGLAELLPLLKKFKLLNADEHQRLEHEVYGRMLRQTGDKGHGATLDTLCDSWHKMPASVHANPGMVRLYARLLVDMEAHAQAEKVILRSLKQAWDPELVDTYGYLQSGDVRRQLGRAEAWLVNHPQDARLFLCLGRLSARDKLWGKARDYFESSYRLQRGSEVCAELGRLLSGLGEANVAAAYFREGLLLHENHLPKLPKPDKALANAKLLARS